MTVVIQMIWFYNGSPFSLQLGMDKSEIESICSQFVHNTEDSQYIVVEYSTKI